MNTHAIISGTPGFPSPRQVTQVGISKGWNRLDISVEIIRGKHQTCPACVAQWVICYLNSEVY
jgi:hypothetical protein